MQPPCLSDWSYSWFPNIQSEDQGNWPEGTWQPPGSASSTQLLFRLPALDISTRECLASPFVNASLPPNTRQLSASWFPIVPTQCANDLTQSMVSLMGSGPYSGNVGTNSTATLSMAADNDTVNCAYTLSPDASPCLNITNVYIIIRDGPIFADDNILDSGNPKYPAWQLTSYDVLSQELSPPFTTPTNWTVNGLPAIGGPNDDDGLSCQITNVGGGISQIYCDFCQITNVGGGYLTDCDEYGPVYSSCCPSLSVNFTGNELTCQDSNDPPSYAGLPCTTSWSTTTWAGSYAESCLSCAIQDIPWLPGQTQITCLCRDDYFDQFVLSSCNSVGCMPDQATGQVILDNEEGSLSCAGAGACRALPSGYISVEDALNLQAARNYTRVIGCNVQGIDLATQLPISITAQSKVVEKYGEHWRDFTYPAAGSYVPSQPAR
jgi:hypothetical protein